MDDFDAEVGRFFEVYNSAWRDNWGFAPMPEAEIRHLAEQLKQIINPNWAFGLETPEGQVVAVCLALPDVNQLMRRVRSRPAAAVRAGTRCSPAARSSATARVWALGVRPDYQHLALGPLLYREIVDRLAADDIRTAEASWTLATNHRINDQLAAMGARTGRRCGACTRRPAARLISGPGPAGPERPRSRPGPGRCPLGLWVAITEARSMARGTAGRDGAVGVDARDRSGPSTAVRPPSCRPPARLTMGLCDPGPPPGAQLRRARRAAARPGRRPPPGASLRPGRCGPPPGPHPGRREPPRP